MLHKPDAQAKDPSLARQACAPISRTVIYLTEQAYFPTLPSFCPLPGSLSSCVIIVSVTARSLGVPTTMMALLVLAIRRELDLDLFSSQRTWATSSTFSWRTWKTLTSVL